MARRRKKGIPLAGKLAIGGAAAAGIWYFFIRKKPATGQVVSVPVITRTVPNVPQSGVVIGTTDVIPGDISPGGRPGGVVFNPIVATQGKGGEPPIWVGGGRGDDMVEITS